MASRALGNLPGGREMEKAVAPVVRCADVLALRDRRRPCLGRAHVIDHSSHATRIPQPGHRTKPAAWAAVMSAQAGIQSNRLCLAALDSRFRGNDESAGSSVTVSADSLDRVLVPRAPALV